MAKIEISMNLGGHDWEKRNIVTKQRLGIFYDTFKCKNCGALGNSYHLGCITVGSTRVVCRKKDIKVDEKYLRITKCSAFNDEFENCIEGSVHKIIQPPKGEVNKRGEWIMGKTEPILLLFSEFEYV